MTAIVVLFALWGGFALGFFVAALCQAARRGDSLQAFFYDREPPRHNREARS